MILIKLEDNPDGTKELEVTLDVTVLEAEDTEVLVNMLVELDMLLVIELGVPLSDVLVGLDELDEY